MIHKSTLLTVFLSSLGFLGLTAKSATSLANRAAAVANTSEVLVFPKGEHDIVDMLAEAGRALSQNYVFDSAEIASVAARKITLTEPLTLQRRQIQQTLFTLAAGRGLRPALIDGRSGVIEWVWMRGPRRNWVYERALAVRAAELDPRLHAGFIVQSAVDLKHLEPLTVQNMLRPFVISRTNPSPITIGNVSNGLMLAGPGEQVFALVQQLRVLDERAAPSVEGSGVEGSGVEGSGGRAGAESGAGGTTRR